MDRVTVFDKMQEKLFKASHNGWAAFRFQALLQSQIPKKYKLPAMFTPPDATKTVSDIISQNLFPCDAPQDMKPISCYGDGNCLFRAVSLLVFGDEDHHVEFRVRTLLELIMNESSYLDQNHLMTVSSTEAATKQNIQEYILLTSVDDPTVDFKDAYRKYLMSTICNGKYSSLLHMYALPNVLQCPMLSIYPDRQVVGIDRNIHNQRINPSKGRKQHIQDPVAIMWTHTVSDSGDNWIPNHFVPCIFKNQISLKFAGATSAVVGVKEDLSLSGITIAKRKLDDDQYSNLDPQASPSESQNSQIDISKRSKLAGAATYGSKFNPDWTRMYPCVSRGHQDNTYSFYCSICEKDVSCHHQGLADVKRHCVNATHIKLAKAKEGTRGLMGMGFVPTGTAVEDQIKRAEVKMAVALAHHNIPLAVMDHLSPLFRDIFPDSKIAQGFSAARTKTTCILNRALRPHFEASLISQMKQEPFTLAIDGSNDNGLQKMNPLTVRIFDIRNCHIETRFLDMCLTSGTDGGTAKSIFSAMDNALESRGIPWDNCVAIAVDNASVNMGKHNSIGSRATQKNEAICMMGCPCHIIHNTAQTAGKEFRKVTRFDVDDFLVDIYYYFDKSTKRKAELEEFSKFCDIAYRKILQHINVRWLSLQTAVERTLQQYPALKSYFKSKDESTPRFKRLQSAFQDDMTEVYLLFFQHVLQYFVRFNLFLQRDDPAVYMVHEEVQTFLRKLMCKFVTIQAIKGSPLPSVDYKNVETQLSDARLQIGQQTQQLAQALFRDGTISRQVLDVFYDGVRAFFVAAMNYGLRTLPVSDDLLQNARFVQFDQRMSADLSQVLYFVHRYHKLLPYTSTSQSDNLGEEFAEYQLLDKEDIPKHVWDDASMKLEEDGSSVYRMDFIWGYLSNMTNANGLPRFGRLAHVAKVVLLIPHSNAGEERVFSMVRKNKTDFRPNLGLDTTLSSLLTVKLATHEPCHKYKPEQSVVKRSKKVTWEYNKEHSAAGKK